MSETQPVKLEERRAMRLVSLDHLPPAAGIAGDRVDRERMVCGQHAGIDERPQDGDRAGGVAAGIGDPPRRRDAPRLSLFEFRKTVGPGWIDPVRGGRVEDAGAFVAEAGDDGGGLARRLVGKAQDRDIDRRQDFGLRARILAVFRRNRNEFDVRRAQKLFADFEACRSRLAVDEDFCHHTLCPKRIRSL